MDSATRMPPRGAALAWLLACSTDSGGGDGGGDGGAGCAVARRLCVEDARTLRAAHPRLAAVVAALGWRWGGYAILDGRAAHNFAAALPRAACGVAIQVATYGPTRTLSNECTARAHAAVRALPSTLTRLRLGIRTPIPHDVRLDHLAALVELDASFTAFGDAAVAAAPSSLVCLRAMYTALTDAARFDHLRRLRTLQVYYTHVGDAALASTPRSLRMLGASYAHFTDGARFGHLRHLRRLFVECTSFGDAALASLAPTVTMLIARKTALTAAARFNHLPRLRSADVRATRVDAAALASLPPHCLQPA